LRRRLLLFTTGLWIGCSRETIVLLPPPTTGASTLVLAIQAETGDPEVEVVALGSSPWRFRTSATGGQHFDVAAFLYACTPDALDLVTGVHGAKSNGQGRPLPSGAKRLISTYDQGKQSPWSEVQDTPPWLSNLRLNEAAPDPCAAFSIQTAIVTGSTNEPDFIVALTSTTVLVGDDGGKIFRVSTDGTWSRLSWSDPAHLVLGAFAGSNGDNWYIKEPACLYKGHAADPPALLGCSANTIAHVDRRAFLEGARDGTTDVFLLSESRMLQHFDGQWSLVRSGAAQGSNQKIKLLWLGRGEALAAGVLSGAMVHAKNGTSAVERIDVGALDEVTTVGMTSQGILAGTNLGFIYRDQNDRWVPFAHPGTVSMRHIYALGDGAFVGGQDGFFAILPPDMEACTAIQYIPSTVRAVVPFGTGFALAGEASPAPLEIVFLSRPISASGCPMMLP
jgi:hypothetical protein